MMRFGHYDSPILLEALGDLLLFDEELDGSKMLAARAYLKASYETSDSIKSAEYREKAAQSLEMQMSRKLPEIEADLKLEIEQADKFFNQISLDEKAWTVFEKNLDQEFAIKYYDAPKLQLNRANWKPMSLSTKIGYVLLSGLAVMALFSIWLVRTIRRKLHHNRSSVVT
jgi:hypothetical protein